MRLALASVAATLFAVALSLGSVAAIVTAAVGGPDALPAAVTDLIPLPA